MWADLEQKMFEDKTGILHEVQGIEKMPLALCLHKIPVAFFLFRMLRSN